MTLYKTANQALKKNMHFAFFFSIPIKEPVADITHFEKYNARSSRNCEDTQT